MAEMARLNRSFIKRWRKARGLSARELGVALGYRGREYIKKIEGGSLPITDRFARRFAQFKNATQNKEYRTREIQSDYPLPRRIKILAKPQRCRICREWFIFPYPQQRVCADPRCQAEAKRMRRRGSRADRGKKSGKA